MGKWQPIGSVVYLSSEIQWFECPAHTQQEQPKIWNIDYSTNFFTV